MTGMGIRNLSGGGGYGSDFGGYGNSPYGSGSGFGIDSVANTLGQSLQSTQDQLTSFMNNMNPNNMDDILHMQYYMIEWETTVQTESAVYKGIGDTLKSVANNVGS
jgi:hypothetical protein